MCYEHRYFTAIYSLRAPHQCARGLGIDNGSEENFIVNCSGATFCKDDRSLSIW